MQIRTCADAVAVWAPAKVNLFLEILGKRPDGYHEIATLMVAIRLWDTLVFREDPLGNLQLKSSNPDLTTGPENLVIRAARLLQKEIGCSRGAHIFLVKRIPIAAGLAGGSTDAAATLAGLNRLWNLGLKKEKLAELSGTLGSDIPFFFHTPAAWCTGRGERVVPLHLGRPLDLVLVCPRMGLSTAEVYRKVKVPVIPEDGEKICRALERGNVEEIGRLLHNRLQAPAESLCSVVSEWFARLSDLKPAGQLMSGSGSSLFALCRDPVEARKVAQTITLRIARDGNHGREEDQPRVFRTRSCTEQLPPSPWDRPPSG